MKILFCGDCVIHSEATVSDNLRQYILAHDYRVCNFEGPVIEGIDCSPSHKAGPHVYNGASSAELLANMGFNVAALANNHIMDFGWHGLENSIKKLEDAGFKHVGAGENYESAYKPLLLENESEQIALFNVGQAEFGIIKSHYDKKPGYAWINSPDFIDTILSEKQKGHRIIIYAHCGLEGCPFPLPEWMDTYRALSCVTGGEIIAAHPHIIQGSEEWNGRLISYSLGNFAFEDDRSKNDQDWNHGLLVSLDTISGKYDIRATKFENNVIDFESRNESQKLISDRNAYIDRDALEKQAQQVSSEYWKHIYNGYYSKLIEGENPITTLKYMAKGMVKRLLGREVSRETMLLHNIQIETHRWMAERYLYNRNNELTQSH